MAQATNLPDLAGQPAHAVSSTQIIGAGNAAKGDGKPVRHTHEPAPPPPELSRVCVIASTAAVGGAVQRARAKRRLRELFRNNQRFVPAGFDFLLIARNSLNRLEYREIERKFVDACQRISPPKA